MADKTKIEWTDATWSPVTGCTVVSKGCQNCYAMQLAGTRLNSHPSRAGLTRQNAAGHHVWTGEVRFNEQWLDQPLRWAKPRMVFVCAHGDLFHEAVPDEWIDRVFAVMALCPQHVFQVLTKRPERMRAYLSAPRTLSGIADAVQPMRKDNRAVGPLPHLDGGERWWPLANVWLGTSIEDQKTADERIPHLLATPAAVRWVSAEPLLGPVDLRNLPPFLEISARMGVRIDALKVGGAYSLDWVVVGGESGANARPMHPDWARSLRDQCKEAGVPFFFKQWGAWSPCHIIDTDEYGELGAAYPMPGCSDDAVHTYEQPVKFWDGESWVFWRDIAPDSMQISEERPVIGARLVGKDRAGRLLDGVEHNAMPGSAA